MVSSIHQRQHTAERQLPDIVFRYDQHKIQKSHRKKDQRFTRFSEEEILGSIFYIVGRNLIKRCELTTQLERQRSHLSVIESGYSNLKVLVEHVESKVRQLSRNFLSCSEEARADLPHLIEANVAKGMFLQLQAFLAAGPQLSKIILEGHNIVASWMNETAIKLDELSDQVYTVSQGQFTEEVSFRDLLLIFVEVFKKYDALPNKRLPCCVQNVTSFSKHSGSSA
jgi:hypothetical protein